MNLATASQCRATGRVNAFFAVPSAYSRPNTYANVQVDPVNGSDRSVVLGQALGRDHGLCWHELPTLKAPSGRLRRGPSRATREA